jgi:hypothetical protein
MLRKLFYFFKKLCQTGNQPIRSTCPLNKPIGTFEGLMLMLLLEYFESAWSRFEYALRILKIKNDDSNDFGA